MPYKRKNEPPGPKPVFNRSLGIGYQTGLKMPAPINELLRQRPIKRLLNWMALDESFKKKILDQVPEHDPPEPEEQN